MNEEEIKELVAQYVAAVTDNFGENAERYMMAFGREVERATRHKAVSMAYTLAEEINHLNENRNSRPRTPDELNEATPNLLRRQAE